MTTNFATTHSITRAKERCGMKNPQTAARNINLALQRGKCADAFTSRERDYLGSISRDNCTALAYNNFCYIVNEYGVCVTLYPLPAWFGKKKRFDGKTKIRDYKQYFNYHYDDCDDDYTIHQ